MTLDSTQLQCLKAADEPLTDEIVEGLEGAGEDARAWQRLPGLVRGALLTDAGPAPELVAGVFADLDLALDALPLGAALADEAGPAPELGDAVLASLGLEDASGRLAAELRNEVAAARDELGELADGALAGTGLRDATSRVRELLLEALDQSAEAEEDPQLIVDGVMARIGAEADPTVDLVASALGEAAGPAPSLWDGVAGELGLGEAVEDAAEVLPFSPRPTEAPPAVEPAPMSTGRPWERWAFASAALAAAAALLLFFTSTDPTSVSNEVIELAAINRVEFEDIQSDEAFVQVFENGDDSPPIIFISEPIEDDLFDVQGGSL